MSAQVDSQREIENIRQTLKAFGSATESDRVARLLRDAEASLDSLVKQLDASEEQSHLAALFRVSQALGTSLDIDEVLNQVMDAVIDLTGAERGFLILATSVSQELEVRAARNIEHENLAERSMEVSRTVIQTVLDSGQGLVTTNAQKDPRFSDKSSVINFSLRSIICAPLLARGATIGVIYVDNRAMSGLFMEPDLSLLNAFATQAAVAIQNAHLYTRTDQSLTERVAELERLSKIDHELTDQLDLDHALELTREWAVKGTLAEAAWIALFNLENTALVVVDGPDEGRSIDPGKPPFAGALVGDVALTVVSGKGGAPERLMVPLRHANRVMGLLVVESYEPLSKLEREFLLRLVARAGSAIANARLYEAVQDANLAKSKFVSVVSHELRLPMTSIKGYSDLLLQGAAGPINEAQTNFLNVIHNNVERMQVLVSDLADISRIETGRLQLSLAQIPMQVYIEQALGSLRPRIEEKNQSLHVKTADDLPPVQADPNRVMQVLSNLISNAWKYTPEGGQIMVSTKAKNGFVYTEVIDNGIGISEEDQRRLFTQFFRSEEIEVREQQGWGLGLHVSRQLVELMGGEIGMNSQLGVGSTFWFTLPAARKAQPETASQPE